MNFGRAEFGVMEVIQGTQMDLVQSYENTSAELLERMFMGVSTTHPVQTRRLAIRLQELQEIPLGNLYSIKQILGLKRDEKY